MNKELGIIEYLLNEVNDEVNLMKEYENAMREAEEKAKNGSCSRWYYFKWYKRAPSRLKIKENLKMIRRITHKIEKGL